MALNFLYLSCLLLSALTATWFWRSLKRMQLILFIPYLWYLNLQEFGLTYLWETGIVKSTAIFYNLYRPFSVTIFFLIFHGLQLNNAPVKRLMARMYGVYLIFAVLILCFGGPITELNRYLSLATGFLISSFALLFLFNYFNLDNAAEERKWFPVIPISIGILAFYPVINISFTFYKHLLKSEVLVFGTKLYQSIPQLMSLLMYSCFTYAFYLCKKRN